MVWHWSDQVFLTHLQHPLPLTQCHSFPWIMEILWKTLTWTLSLVVMAASEFESINRLSHNSQGMTAGGEDFYTCFVTNSMFTISSFPFFSSFPCKRGVPVLPAALPTDCPGAGGWEGRVPELHCEAPPAWPTETWGCGPHYWATAFIRSPRVPAVLQTVSLWKALSLKPDTQPPPGVKTFYSGVLGQRRAGVAS